MMQDQKVKHGYTPGPWETTPDGVPDWATQVGGYGESGDRIATVVSSNADADLIAAAPDLYAAAKRMADAYAERKDVPPDFEPYRQSLLRAIEKAEA